MKVRKGFVSNSSSQSYVIDMTNMPEDLKGKICNLKDRSDDSSRCTGKIVNIKEWVKEIGEWNGSLVEKLLLYADNPNVIIVRESDEEMGGSFEDHDFTVDDLEHYTLFDFEWH